MIAPFCKLYGKVTALMRYRPAQLNQPEDPLIRTVRGKTNKFAHWERCLASSIE